MFIDKKIAVHLNYSDITKAIAEYAERALREHGVQIVVASQDVTAVGIPDDAVAVVKLEPRR